MASNILSNVKIIKRHNAAGILIGILAILATALPVVYWILPWLGGFTFDNVPGVGSMSTPINLSAFHIVMNVFNIPTTSTEIISHVAYEISQLRESVLTYYLIKENLIAAGIWYILSVLCSVILFFQALVLLIRGKLNHPHSIVWTAFFVFLTNGFCFGDAVRLGYHLEYAALKAAEMTEATAIPTFGFIFWPGIIVASAAFGFYFLILVIYLCGLRKRYYREDIIFVDVEEKPFEKNNGVLRNTLPNSVTSIGGHEFAKNTNLEIANIPYGIKELGIGAFANCLKLKVVSIPTSVKHIGTNCFFNCGSLQRLNYGGTKQQWRYITRGSNWLDRAGTTTVLCTDGPISVNPKH